MPKIHFLVLAILPVPALAQDFPLTIAHKFGTTVIEARPERVASLDFNGADNLLALGIQPVTVRDWYGDHPRGVWPWADTLMDSNPKILRGELDFEQIATTDPDVIIALWSGITAEEYERLTLIAPVVAVPEGVGDYALPWDELALTAGRVVGREADAEAKVAAIRDRLAEVAAEHPDWQGLTAAVAGAFEGEVGAYTSADIRPLVLAEMGFQVPEEIDTRVGANEFWVSFSQEDLSPIDADLLLWIDGEDNFAGVNALAARPFLTAHREGREIFLGEEITSAFSHSSLLSLPLVIDRLVPMIETALDGDPETHADDR
ncbi:ABC transporter substrate-binding protein [Rubellimicrobium roseum]|uniref:Iron-siderophore ABC transporter substrate-binding protein n=1 Tax=Rubellimicrobium roseum TaxID=687525 RepID=A0A5C4N6F5_9RHOB|nr:ABC transporter substrate-binding protein [Rubellimicrobium roseum]TNC61813.1 iron-siderophore ABC transporter substrate-binding protein [Rubellimicrobium roseum]